MDLKDLSDIEKVENLLVSMQHVITVVIEYSVTHTVEDDSDVTDVDRRLSAIFDEMHYVRSSISSTLAFLRGESETIGEPWTQEEK